MFVPWPGGVSLLHDQGERSRSFSGQRGVEEAWGDAVSLFFCLDLLVNVSTL